MKTKLFFSTLTMAAALAVTPAVFADNNTTIEGLTGSSGSTEYGSDGTYTDTSGSTVIGTVKKDYQRVMTSGTYWTGVSITTSGTVGGYGLTITTNNGTTDQDLYFTGGENSSLTITDLTVSNGSATSGRYSTTKAFIVEGTTVILDGVEVDELGMNLVVGTEYLAGDATLVITNGSTVSTGAFYNTVGSNLSTGTITIENNSTLSTQQITLGGGVDSLSALASTSAGDYWTKCFVTQDTFNSIKLAITSGSYDPTSGSYGIVNVYSGSTWEVGVGNLDPSNNRLQLSNGEVNIDSGSLIFGKNSSLMMCNENLFSVVSGTPNSDNSDYPIYTGMNISEKITVKNGGTVSVEDNGTLAQLVIGETFVAENVTASVSVYGDGSSFAVSVSNAVYIGASAGYWTNTGTTTAKYNGGTADVTVSATNGGVINISSTETGIVVCADNYASYIGDMTSGTIYTDVGHSYGLKVELSATDGGSLTLAAEKGYTVLLAAGSPYDEYTNELTVKADGDGSSVSISGGDIYTNFGEDGTGGADSVSVAITAKDGGTIALSAAQVGDKGNGVISFGKNTLITVENGSSLTTDGTVVFNAGASIAVDATSKWTVTGEGTTVEFASGSGIEVGAAAVAEGDGSNDVSVVLGAVTIAEGASIIVTIDISSLGYYESASVAILTAESIIFGYTGDPDPGTTLTTGNTGDNDTLASFVLGYVICEENGFTIDSWSYTSDGTLYANIRTLPEPSMFGLFAGLMAVGLVSTRRRRRKA